MTPFIQVYPTTFTTHHNKGPAESTFGYRLVYEDIQTHALLEGVSDVDDLMTRLSGGPNVLHTLSSTCPRFEELRERIVRGEIGGVRVDTSTYTPEMLEIQVEKLEVPKRRSLW